DLEAYLERIHSIVGDKPVMCSLQFAAQLVDIDSYGLLAGDVKDAPDRIAKLKADLLNDTTITVRKNQVVIGADPRGHRLFNNALEFGLFQGLVWELIVPLNAAFFRSSKKYSDVLTFLGAVELLDIPGVSRAYKRREQSLFD